MSPWFSMLSFKIIRHQGPLVNFEQLPPVGHLGHLTLTIYIGFHSPFLYFSLIGHLVLEKMTFENNIYIHAHGSKAGPDNKLGSKFSHKDKPCQFGHLSISFQ